MRGVDRIYTTEFAIALVLKDGTAVPWDDKKDGGDPNDAQAALRGVDNFYSIQGVFAVVWKEWTVVTWVDKENGEDSNTVQSAFGQVDKIYSTDSAFADVCCSLKAWDSGGLGFKCRR